MITLWQKEALLYKSFFSLKRGSVIYRVFDYFSIIFFMFLNNILYINIWYAIELLEDSWRKQVMPPVNSFSLECSLILLRRKDFHIDIFV